VSGRTRTLKLARFGDNMRFVAVTEGDKTDAEFRFGVQVNAWALACREALLSWRTTPTT
jgi:L-arabinose isomerase